MYACMYACMYVCTLHANEADQSLGSGDVKSQESLSMAAWVVVRLEGRGEAPDAERKESRDAREARSDGGGLSRIRRAFSS